MYGILGSLCSLSLFVISANGLSMPIHRRASSPAHSTMVQFSTMTTTSANSENFNFTNEEDTFYGGTIYVSGQEFLVLLDTGSSDLWVVTANVTLQDVQNTGVHGEIDYGKGSAAGPILTGEVSFGNFTVKEQAFISASSSDAALPPAQGLMGIGRPSTSNVASSLAQSDPSVDGSAFLVQVFQFYPDEPNFISFNLTRSDIGATSGGTFTIGEVPDDLSAINNAPMLYVNSPKVTKPGLVPEWSTLMDGIWVNGTFFEGGSADSDLQKTSNQTRAGLDSGATYSYIPQFYLDAIYKDVPGAKFDRADGVYLLPCDAYVNVTFVFAGKEYPIHPLDAVTTEQGFTDNKGNQQCFGGFFLATNSDTANFDFWLGDSFLRNVYSKYDFGDWVPGETGTPFIQLLSMTNGTQAAIDYPAQAQRRLQLFNSSSTSGSSDSTAEQLDNTDSTSTPSSSSSSLSGTVDLTPLEHDFDIVEGLLGGIILILLGILVAMFMQERKKNREYRPIHHPVPVPAFARDDEGQAKYSTP